MADSVVRVRGLETAFGRQRVHRGVDFDVPRGEIVGLVGGSGQGKSVLLRCLLGFVVPSKGRIDVLGECIDCGDERALRAIRRRMGVLFQDGALFTAMNVLCNAAAPLREHTTLSGETADVIARGKLRLVGLDQTADTKFPRELSGGMRKRAGLARALALDPELLLLDEPTAGLDPVGAAGFDRLIAELRDALGLTVLMVTHDLDTLFGLCDRAIALVDGRAIVDTPRGLAQRSHPWLKDYFAGVRGRAAAAAA